MASPMAVGKEQRQRLIREIVVAQEVYTQEELAELLAARGINATQVTLSRDIRELGLVKTPDGYQPLSGARAAATAPDLAAIITEFVRSVKVAQHTLVLRTAAGHAQPVAVALDERDLPEVVGTIAGDDTVLIVSPDHETALKLQSKLRQYLA